ncbi:MAG TPA: RHS repeat-associated core domain-containing protein, partial [Nitrospirota bacterium]|nr:RHS repeat-associated core domain-containing protein [Nitrospirota bacterium]
NRLWTVTDWLGKITTYSYDDAGNLFDILNPNNTKVVYAYDTADRLTGLSNTKSDSTVISSYTYTLDAIGNHENTAQNEPLIPIIPSQNVTYTHDAENRMTDAGGVTNTFDANGNMTARGSDTFTYDYNDRLVESTVGGVLTQYKYDGFGNRLVKIEGGTTTRYVQDINGSLNNVLAETDATGTIAAYYVYGLGLISKVLPDGTAHYYHYDSRGSTIALTDAGENVTDSYAYDPFGNVVNRTGATANPFRYVGRYGLIDEGNGLTYIRARYYVPELGRFITKDPLTGKDGDTQSLNRYVYAVNNPVRLVDISGLSPLEKIGNFFNELRKHTETHLGGRACLVICVEGEIVHKDGKVFLVLGGGGGLAAELKAKAKALLENSPPLEEGWHYVAKSGASLAIGHDAAAQVEWFKCKIGGEYDCQHLNLKLGIGPLVAEDKITNPLDKYSKGGFGVAAGGGADLYTGNFIWVKRLL